MDLVSRLGDLRAHYTDAGILPRELLHKSGLVGDSLSVLFGFGSSFAVGLIFILAIISATSLLLGYRTRLFTVLTWLFVLSIQNRNPLVLYGVDDVIRLLLFWSIFLPLGRCWSVDSFRHPKLYAGGQVSGLAPLAFILQVAFIYWFSFFLKSSPEWWPNLTAVFYSLHLDMYSSSIGRYFLEFPDVLKGLTASVLALELLAPILLFIPFRQSFFRLFCISLFVAFHVGLIITMEIHLFPYACIAMWLALLPSTIWKRTPVSIRGPRFVELIVGACLVLGLIWNLSYIGVFNHSSSKLRSLTSAIGLQQSWGMFAPSPKASDGWVVVEAEKVNSKRFDWILGPDKKLNFIRPKEFQERFPNGRWKKLYENLLLPDWRPYRESFANYICDTWNQGFQTDHRQQIRELRIYYMLEWVAPKTGKAPVEKILLLEFDCISRKVKM